MPDAHKNFAYSTVATAPSPPTSGTSLVVQAGDGATFPATPFNAVICPAAPAIPRTTTAEVVRVTTVSTDTFTITRAQENSTARAVGVGDQIYHGVTVRTLLDAPLGYISSVDKTSGTTFTTVETDLASLTLTWTALANRVYRYTIVVHFLSTVSLDTMDIYLTDGSSVHKRGWQLVAVGTSEVSCTTLSWEETGIAAGSVTRKMRGIRAGGTGTCQIYGDGTFNSRLTVEDIGSDGTLA